MCQPGDPCQSNERCLEADDRCCVPNVATGAPRCDASTVVADDNCGDTFVVKDCTVTPGSYGICENASCGCPPGVGGASCNCTLYLAGDAEVSGNGSSWATAINSLQAAIDEASRRGGCAVWIKAGRYAGRFTLRDGVRLYGGFAGDETQFSARNVGANVVQLDGQGQGAVLTYASGAAATTHARALVEGVTIVGGSNSGLRAIDAAPIIDNCRFVGNRGSRGGALYLERASAIVVNASFEANVATDGTNGANGDDDPSPWPAVGEAGDPGNIGGSGGAIYSSQSDLSLSGCTFRGNHAGAGGAGGMGGSGTQAGPGGSGARGGHGGVLFMTSGTLDVTGCAFIENVAGNGGTGGRGYYDNEAAFGGAVGASGDGGSGGVFYLDAVTTTVRLSAFFANRAGSGASGADARSHLAGANGGAGGRGGAIWASTGSLTVRGCRFISQQAGDGGAAGAAGRDNDTILSGPASPTGAAGGLGGHGGAIYTTGCNLDVQSSSFRQNQAGNGGAGGSGPTGLRQTYSCRSTTRPARDGGAGGSGGNGGMGGDLFATAGQLRVESCTFTKSSAGQGGAGGNGGKGGIACQGTRGGAGGSGGTNGAAGAIHVDGAQLQLINATISANTTSTQQPAAGAGGPGGDIIDSATTGPAGAAGSNGVLSAAGGLQVSGGQLSAVNTIIWGNTAGTTPAQLEVSGPNTAAITHSIVEGGCTTASGCTTDQTGNSAADPLFITGTLHLSSASPAVDKGSATAVKATTGALGEPRSFDGDGNSQAQVDIGGLERVNTTQAASCAQLKTQAASAQDGSYPLYSAANARYWVAYCKDMASTAPKAYLLLDKLGASQNYASYVANTSAHPGDVDLISRYAAVLVDESTLQIQVSDTTFATHTGHITHGTTPWTSIEYARAMSCRGANDQSGSANVDLRGTPFRVAPDQFVVAGYQAAGSNTYSASDQVVALTGGGYCGYSQATGGTIQLIFQ
jgi:hypothetical protein